MGRISRREKIVIEDNVLAKLRKLANSRTEEHRKVQRAKIITMNQNGFTDTEISRTLNIDMNTVKLCLKKCLTVGAMAAIEDLPKQGAPHKIFQEDKAWIIYLACEKPKEFGYAQEIWTITLLLKHIHENAVSKGFPRLAVISRSALWYILNNAEIKPHKMNYYLEKKDPEFEKKMTDVLMVYKDINYRLEKGAYADQRDVVTVSYDEKPGVQAIGNIAPDLNPQPYLYSGVGRDYEYVRFATLSLFAGINLITGEITADVSETYKSSDFIRFLNQLDERYSDSERIRLVLDNHSAHVSKETVHYLESKPNRFEFIFTPKHGSWLNIIEGFFSKLTRVFLRGIRVESKDELRQRLLKYISEVNENPTVIKWKYKMDEIIL